MRGQAFGASGPSQWTGLRCLRTGHGRDDQAALLPEGAVQTPSPRAASTTATIRPVPLHEGRRRQNWRLHPEPRHRGAIGRNQVRSGAIPCRAQSSVIRCSRVQSPAVRNRAQSCNATITPVLLQRRSPIKSEDSLHPEPRHRDAIGRNQVQPGAIPCRVRRESIRPRART